MAHFNTAYQGNYGVHSTPTSFLIRLGIREIFVCRDMRRRFYRTNPVIDCTTGIERGHLEILLFRKWLVILSRARA